MYVLPLNCSETEWYALKRRSGLKNALLVHFNDDRYYIWNVQLVFDTCITTANQHRISN